MAKEKMIRYAKGLLKAVISQFAIYAIILVVMVTAVGIIFQLFGFLKFWDKDAKQLSKDNKTLKKELKADFSKGELKDMKIWAESLSEEEIREMEEFAEIFDEEDIKELQEFGAMVHPRKVPTYFEIEDESYKKNVNIKVPVETTVIFNGEVTDNKIDFINYLYKRGDTAYPYRQWWQSTTGLDSINDTSDKEEEVELIDSARDNLKPIFKWADPETPYYNENDRYEFTSDLEEVETLTTTKDINYSLQSVYIIGDDGKPGEDSKDSGKIQLDPKDNGWTDTEVTIVKETKPLPYLNDVETMFALHGFKYKPDGSISTSGGSFTSTTMIEKDVVVDGVKKRARLNYIVKTNVSYVFTFDTWFLTRENKDFVSRFYDFLVMHEINTTEDPWVMHLMAETLPQNYDFLSQYTDYLGFIESMNEFRGPGYQDDFFDGDFGDFEGGELLFPVSSYKRISSYYGYRSDPMTGVTKFHAGIDISANTGTDIYAVEDGTVTYAGMHGTMTTGYGYMVEINHGGGITTRYAHCSKILVSKGQTVTKGQVIAKVGSTGKSTGPHLHFEVRKNGAPTDPLPWITGD